MSSCCFKALQWQRQGCRNIPIITASVLIVASLTAGAWSIWDADYTLTGACAAILIESLMLLAVSSVAKQVQKQVDRFQQQNHEYSSILKEDRANIDLFDRENQELKEVREQLKQELESLRDVKQELDAENEELRQAVQALHQSREALLTDHQQMKVTIKSLSTENGRLTLETDRLRKIAQDLNEFQRKNVQMIQALALYGEEAKNVGFSLKEVAQDLKETDDELGLTADELQKQVNALTLITQQLSKK